MIFLVMITAGKLRHPVFVNADSIGEAHTKAVAQTRYLQDAATFSIEVFVIDEDVLRKVLK